MQALSDKQELKARNKAYKTTLEYCPETCDDVDEVFNTALYVISKSDMFDEEAVNNLKQLLDSVSTHVKDVGTRKLRQAFTTYILDQQISKGFL